MAIAQRIKGQEVSIEILENGVPTDSFSDVRSFTVTPKLDKKEEEYLGETTKRYDEVFNGVDFDIEFNFHDRRVLDFITTITDRAIRRDILSASTVVNIKARMYFPNGDTPMVVLQNCYFSDIPVGFGSRSDYGTIKLSGSSANWKLI